MGQERIQAAENPLCFPAVRRVADRTFSLQITILTPEPRCASSELPRVRAGSFDVLCQV